MRNQLRELAAERGEWAGYPLPIEGARLVIEPSYPYAKDFERMSRSPADAAEDQELLAWGFKERNVFWSMRYRSWIHIYELDGKIRWGMRPAIHHMPQEMHTLFASEAWGIEQESNAIHLLGTLLKHRPFKQYLLTGMFMERSPRSGLTYLFRKLRPTVVIDARGEGPESVRVLCCLCMHPIAYYEGSWAGAMTPTDDVVAHLMMMRGDEHMFWKRSNQHPAWYPGAGLGA